MKPEIETKFATYPVEAIQQLWDGFRSSLLGLVSDYPAVVALRT